MISFTQDLTVAWGDCDPFGQVYYPKMFEWLNETEHELLRQIGFSTNALIEKNRSAFVMVDINFQFVGPARFGDRVHTKVALEKIGSSSLHWRCTADQLETGAGVTKGMAVRVHAQVQPDGGLKPTPIPDDLRAALTKLNTEAVAAE